jgi:hypothetical protein
MSGPKKLLVLAVVLIFGLATFVLGVDMVASPNVYEWLIPPSFAGFLGQALMFLAFMFTFGILAFFFGLLRFGEEEPVLPAAPPLDILAPPEPRLDGKRTAKPKESPESLLPKAAPPVPEEELPHLIGLTGGLPNRIRLEIGTFTIGRDAECDLVLSSQLVSRRHAQLEWTGETLLIHDLGSSNQTRVNDKVLEREIPLEDGDVIQIVDYHLEVELPVSLSRTVLIPKPAPTPEDPPAEDPPAEEEI